MKLNNSQSELDVQTFKDKVIWPMSDNLALVLVYSGKKRE